jgi:hypothetical protein
MNINKNPEFPYSLFPYRLEHMERKEMKDKKICLFESENTITKEFINSIEKERLQDFLKFTPFPTKKRLFTYTTENAGTNSQKNLIKGLGATENYNTNNKTWNDEISGDVYVSKVKFN